MLAYKQILLLIEASQYIKYHILYYVPFKTFEIFYTRVLLYLNYNLD